MSTCFYFAAKNIYVAHNHDIYHQQNITDSNIPKHFYLVSLYESSNRIKVIKMTDITWEKVEQRGTPVPSGNKTERLKFIIGGLLIFAAIGYLIVMGTLNNTQYFITVDELLSNPEYIGQTVRISGAVIGETIQYDSQNLIIDFTIAHIPKDTDNLAYTLYQAVQDPQAARLQVHVENQVKPDLLKNEAQAILTGTLGDDGVFYATELLLKCPSRYEDVAPDQVSDEGV
ncbi:MAG: cytochrome c maturation protein CcmE [Chloroflexi bacterium]|nr:MAG: cytochrome c maturation protein CcmE [Chloroflexota bacterium]